MTQANIELVLKDLSARLPYNPMVQLTYQQQGVEGVDEGQVGLHYFEKIVIDLQNGTVLEIKPFLRPMSSMTEEEKKEIYDWLVENDVDYFDFNKLRLDEILISFDSSWLLIDWLNAHHFDYRNLIGKGLALPIIN